MPCTEGKYRRQRGHARERTNDEDATSTEVHNNNEKAHTLHPCSTMTTATMVITYCCCHGICNPEKRHRQGRAVKEAIRTIRYCRAPETQHVRHGNCTSPCFRRRMSARRLCFTSLERCPSGYAKHAVRIKWISISMNAKARTYALGILLINCPAIDTIQGRRLSNVGTEVRGGGETEDGATEKPSRTGRSCQRSRHRGRDGRYGNLQCFHGFGHRHQR